ncbi:MAG: hypothetical protein JKX98_03955, partial [Alcanivoracaceae bacterium]|nr:hypothetical protein [Alcanivoracaceae bacterium]
MDKERKIAIEAAEAAGYLPTLRKLVMKSTVPLWWSRSSVSFPKSISHNGTMCIVDTGEKFLGVTADHVFKQYQNDCKCFDDIECQIGNVRIDLEKYLIDSNSELDIATFDLPPILVAGSGVNIHVPSNWPPKMLVNSEMVLLGGYPGFLREEKIDKAEFSFVTFFVPVAQSSINHASFQLNLADSHWPDGSGGIPEGTNLGGISGGPVFRFKVKPAEHLELA